MRQTRRDFFGVAIAGALAGAAATTAGGAAFLRATDTKTTTAPCEAPPPVDTAHMLAAGQEIDFTYMGFTYTGLVDSVVYGSVDGVAVAEVGVRVYMPGNLRATFQVRNG